MDKNRTKVLVTGHDLKFWYPLQQALEETGEFEFREDVWKGHDSHDDLSRTDALLQWADVVVAEWALGNAVYCSRRKRAVQKLIIRFHAQERFTGYPGSIDHSNVDWFVFVGEHIQTQAIRKFLLPHDRVVTVGNIVDTSRFGHSKMGGVASNIGMIGVCPAQKRMDQALDVLRILLEHDPNFMLHIKGPSPQSYPWLWARTKEREYYERVFREVNSDDLRYHVVFDPHGDDVPQWLRKVGFILSPSDSESFHMAVAEGASSKSIPVLWNREGSQAIYPAMQTVSSPAEAARWILTMGASSAGERYAEQVSGQIKAMYGREVIRDAWRDLLLGGPQSVLPDGLIPADGATRRLLIVYGIDEWATFHRREMLLALAGHLDEWDILVIEPGSHYRTLLEKQKCPQDRLERALRMEPERPVANLAVTRVLFGSKPENSMDGTPILVADSFRSALRDYVAKLYGDGKQCVHWIYKPHQVEHLPEGDPYIYEVYDEYTMDFSTGRVREEVALKEKATLANASHVFFTSDPLSERKKALCPASSIVGNGVSFDVFDRYRIDVKVSSISRRTVGYLGNLSDFFDWKTMLQVCERMPHCDFFLHGQIESERMGVEALAAYERMRSMKHVFFSGRVTRPVGAAAVNRYDALIIPFVVNDAMHAVNPLKLWEYFATGKAVVSSPMDAIQIEDPLLRVADSVEDWVRSLEAAVEERNPSHAEKRIELARAHSWDVLTLRHAEVLKSILASHT